ncbi:DUF4845 domain-containing protein [Pseudoxanthomonas composti]|uniref:DUF4845 domain-containing protein n=1 Tax=Pseudoxanthomonas composti TaxID=2137479 RepID=A0A4Q1JRS0_9GAMM|nr:DUF4845 domain-containing protein [Pseudoxanthomonas composti]RXR00934.1 DUF4845 domain-containing protein [Pseudoxanthomonas composti]
MNKRDKQQGLTLTSFVLVLAVVGFFAYVGMKLVPMYIEFYAVKTALNGLSKEPGVADMDPSKIQDLFFKRMDVDSADNIKPSNVKVERMDGGWKMTVKYEVRRDLIANLDVVGKFDAEKALTLRATGQ